MLDRFFTLSIDMLCIAGYDGYFKRLNPAFERTLGYRIEELTASPFLDFVHPDDRSATTGVFQRVLHGEATISFENRYRAKDGSYKWLLWNAMPFAEQQLIYAAARDISERKQAEENVQRLRGEAEAANRAKSEFLARMSHEIRTPLNVVIGMGDLLERTPLNAEQHQYVRVCQRAGSNLLTLVNDILDLSKVESGRIILEEIDFSLAEALETTVEILTERAKQKGIDLRYAIAPGTPATLTGDPGRLRQILLNLTGNAIKFTEKGQVLIRAEPETARYSAGILRFSVSDTGIGIAPDQLDLIFETFTQADASVTRKYGGSGLGLAISKRLVELMDGRIWVESAPARGATFYFTAKFGMVAAATALGTGHEPFPAPPAIHGESLRILAVDDSEENRFLVAGYLKELNCQIEFAENGEIALRKFAAGAYDLVLMDLEMPVMDGYTAAARMRAWEAERKRRLTPILALTASALEADLRRALEAGCTTCLRKPVRLHTLIDAVMKHTARTGLGGEDLERIVVRADDRLRAVVPEYLTKRREDVGTMQAALDRADFHTIRELAHKISGTGGSYGFPRLTEIGTALESAARQENPEQVRAQVEELSRYLGRVEVV